MKKKENEKSEGRAILNISLPPPRKIFSFVFVSVFCLIFYLSIKGTWDFQRLARKGALFSGDEPKYLRMVESLAKYGQFDISRIVLTPEEKEAVKKKAEQLGPHRWGDLYVIGIHGGIYCLHMPGFPLLILPSYKLDSIIFPNDPKKASGRLKFLPQKLALTRLWLLGISLLSFILLFRLLDRLFFSLILKAVLFMLFILNSPFSDYSFRFYPDVVATFFCLLALNAIFYPFYERRANDFFLVCGIGFLPWFHQRFIPLSLGLFLALLFFRKRANISFKRIAAIILLLALVSLPYFYYFYHITGNPSPLSISRAHGEVYARLNTLSLGFFGNLFSRTMGIVWAYPWVILFFFGTYLGWKKDRIRALSLLTIFIPYYLMCSAGIPWSGVTLPPGRFLMPLFPIFLIFGGMAIHNLIRDYSHLKLIFYVAYFSLILLNKLLWYINFNFTYSHITAEDLVWIIKSIGLILFMYGSLIIAEKFVFLKKLSPKD